MVRFEPGPRLMLTKLSVCECMLQEPDNTGKASTTINEKKAQPLFVTTINEKKPQPLFVM